MVWFLFNTKAYYRHSFWKGVSRLDKRAKIGGGAKKDGKYRERQGLERFLMGKNRFFNKKGEAIKQQAKHLPTTTGWANVQ